MIQIYSGLYLNGRVLNYGTFVHKVFKVKFSVIDYSINLFSLRITPSY